jgi:hypothetical protein
VNVILNETDTAYKLDPRVKKYREEQQMKKERMKQERLKALRRKKEEVIFLCS